MKVDVPHDGVVTRSCPAHGKASDHANDPARVREFFTARAAGWDARYAADEPAFVRAVLDLGLRPGDRVLDAGCGTGRTLPALREAVGPTGVVLGVDLTPAMLTAAREAGRDRLGWLGVGDVTRLPVRSGVLDASFAAGLIDHLPSPEEALRELARVTRPGGSLMLFHPLGRATLAARHGRDLSDDDPRARARLDPLLTATGWTLTDYLDEDARFLALAQRLRS